MQEGGVWAETQRVEGHGFRGGCDGEVVQGVGVVDVEGVGAAGRNTDEVEGIGRGVVRGDVGAGGVGPARGGLCHEDAAAVENTRIIEAGTAPFVPIPEEGVV